MFCSVIPYSKSFDDTLLTYDIPDFIRASVEVGSSVMIPFGKETIIGIIVDIAHEIAYEWEIKSIVGVHCKTPWFSPSEIACIVGLSRRLFTRIHVISQLFLPIKMMNLLEKTQDINMIKPQNTIVSHEWKYIIAPDEKSIIHYLDSATKQWKCAIILPEWISVKSWASHFGTAIIDQHPKSLTSQKKIYEDILRNTSPLLIGTRRTLLKRIGWFSQIYIVYDHHASDIFYGQKSIPLTLLAEFLELSGHSIHYITTTPSVRILCDFLKKKKSIHYLS